MAEHNRLGVIMVFMLILLLTPDTGPVTRRNETEKIIEKAKRELDELRNSTYGVPGNITGLEEIGRLGPDGSVVMMPPKAVRTTVEEMIKSILGEDVDFDNSPEGVIDGSDNFTTEAETNVPEDDEDLSRGLGEKESIEKHASRRDNLQLPLGHTELPLYYNASGGIYGSWHRLYDLPPYRFTNSTQEAEKNITGHDGKITIRIEESRPGDVQEVQARISFGSEDGFDSHDVLMSGIHMVKSGDMVLTTNSKDFSGLFALPHLTLTKSKFEASRAMLNQSLSDTIKRQEKSPDGNILWSSPSSLISDTFKCEYITYLQLHPIRKLSLPPNTYPLWHPMFWFHYFFDPTPITPSTLRLIERELRHPTGIPVPLAPPIALDGVVYSPNCGFVISTKGATGVKIEQFHNRVKNFALTAAVVVAVQTWLLIRQMNESSTPSTVSRVSFWSIAMMAIVDGYMAGAFILVSVMVESSYLALVTAAFLSFVLVVVFGMRFLITIWGVQRPERRAAAAAAAAAASTPAPAPAPAPSLPAPATATAQTPLIAPQNDTPAATNPPPADDGRQDISTIYSRFYFLLIGGAFLFLHVSTWSPPHRHIFVSICAVLACSFWVPQIYRNIMRGCRKALGWGFVLGTSICRVLPVVYLFCLGSRHGGGTGDNIFGFEFRGMETVGYAVSAWLAFQVFALWVQEWAGPRVGIPGSLLPRAYDYHPILPVDDLEAAQPFSAATPTSPTASHEQGSGGGPGLRSFDCAICMHPVEVLTAAAGTGSEGGGGVTGGLGGLVTRRSYMVTPCRHVFHAQCLEGWMRMRLQCPICRNQLPPL